MHTVLAAIDFSPVSRSVAALAVTLARTIHGRVVFFHAVQPPPIVVDLAPLVGEALKFTGEIERSSLRHLHRLQQQWKRRGVAVDTICRQGSPVPLIVAWAKELGSRYIVVGSHGHTAFYDLVAGSTASGVLKRAPCPVVVVPAVPRKRRTAARPRASVHVQRKGR